MLLALLVIYFHVGTTDTQILKTFEFPELFQIIL